MNHCIKIETEKIKFDMLFLGISGEPGKHIIDNIYYYTS
jgi:hypothetical protein